MIHLIVGNTGSGKTTYANQLKQTSGGIVFSIDQWNKVLFLPDKEPEDGLEWFLERIERVEVMILRLVDQLENENTDAILDLGLSKFEHREKFRRFATDNGYSMTTHFLDVPKEIRLSRVLNRNIEKGAGYEFEVTRDHFEFMETWFEKPSDYEMKDGIVITHQI